MKISSKVKFSTKHLLIDKANSTILLAAAVTVAVVIFSVVVSKTLIAQSSYQSKVIGLRSKANTQLKSNIQSVEDVVEAFKTFESADESVVGTADKNSKIILDALPSKYDFPALVTSLEALILSSGGSIVSINGTDDEAAAEQDSTDPQPIEIPFTFTAVGQLDQMQKIISQLEASIRPIQINSVTLNVVDRGVQLVVSAKTYYQPEKMVGFTPGIVTKDGKISLPKPDTAESKKSGASQ